MNRGGVPAHVQREQALVGALWFVSAAWQAETGKRATISYAASSALAKQIEQGAPADVLVAADLDWMAWLADRGLIREGTEVRLLGNRLVLVAPGDSTASAEIAPGFDLAGLLGDGRLAMANVDGCLTCQSISMSRRILVSRSRTCLKDWRLSLARGTSRCCRVSNDSKRSIVMGLQSFAV